MIEVGDEIGYVSTVGNGGLKTTVVTRISEGYGNPADRNIWGVWLARSRTEAYIQEHRITHHIKADGTVILPAPETVTETTEYRKIQYCVIYYNNSTPEEHRIGWSDRLETALRLKEDVEHLPEYTLLAMKKITLKY